MKRKKALVSQKVLQDNLKAAEQQLQKKTKKLNCTSVLSVPAPHAPKGRIDIIDSTSDTLSKIKLFQKIFWSDGRKRELNNLVHHVWRTC